MVVTESIAPLLRLYSYIERANMFSFFTLQEKNIKEKHPSYPQLHFQRHRESSSTLLTMVKNVISPHVRRFLARTPRTNAEI